MNKYTLHFHLPTTAKITKLGKQIGTKIFKMLQTGYNSANDYYIDPDTKNLIEQNCPKKDIPAINSTTIG